MVPESERDLDVFEGVCAPGKEGANVLSVRRLEALAREVEASRCMSARTCERDSFMSKCRSLGVGSRMRLSLFGVRVEYHV